MYIKLLRMYQYIKNLFIFAPLFFSGYLLDNNSLINTLIAFIMFSLLASSVYIINDLKDLDEDKKHPKKKYRPIASGKISKNKALIISGILMTLSLLGSFFFLNINVFSVFLIYLIINILYTFYLKNHAPYDILIISIGFVLRLFIGSFAANVPLSEWIVINTFFLALFLITTKRYIEVKRKNENSSLVQRKSIDGYSLYFIIISLAITSSMSLFAYLMFTISKGGLLYLSTFFVLAGFFRFIQLALTNDETEDTTRIVVKDIQLHIIIFLWILFYVGVIYV